MLVALSYSFTTSAYGEDFIANFQKRYQKKAVSN